MQQQSADDMSCQVASPVSTTSRAGHSNAARQLLSLVTRPRKSTLTAADGFNCHGWLQAYLVWGLCCFINSNATSDEALQVLIDRQNTSWAAALLGSLQAGAQGCCHTTRILPTMHTEPSVGMQQLQADSNDSQVNGSPNHSIWFDEAC